MKKSDIATIVLIAGFSILVASILSNAILGDVSERSVKLQYLDVISGEISEPDPELFNAEAINPTEEIYIGQCTDGQVWDEPSKTCIDQPEPEEEDEEDEETSEDQGTDEDENTEDEGAGEEGTDDQAPTE